jgi:hypothetical protein
MVGGTEPAGQKVGDRTLSWDGDRIALFEICNTMIRIQGINAFQGDYINACKMTA